LKTEGEKSIFPLLLTQIEGKLAGSDTKVAGEKGFEGKSSSPKLFEITQAI
jgi:hypothetical protein